MRSIKWLFALLGMLPLTGSQSYSQVTSIPADLAATSIVYTHTDTSIVATWSTASAVISKLNCSGIPAIDASLAVPQTSHEQIVEGLTASTAYVCAIRSGPETSTPTTVTTSAAQTRTAITTVSLGSATATANTGDSFANCVLSDNNTYITEDDGNGFTTANTGANMQIGKLTTEASLVGSLVNLLSNYGAAGATSGTDGPGGVALTNKLSGLFCMGGDLYGYANRDWYLNNTGMPNQTAYGGNIIVSADKGVTWNNFQNIGGNTANGLVITPITAPGVTQFPIYAYGWCAPVLAAEDDGTLGYKTAGNGIDGNDGYVYTTCTDGYWNNSSNLYMFRQTRLAMSLQQSNSFQWWTGPTSPASTDFVNPANWSTVGTPTSIYSPGAGEVSAQSEFLVPTNNEYILSSWYQPTPGTTSISVWNLLTGPTPAGPWSSLIAQTYNPQGYYGFQPLHRAVAANASTTNIAIPFFFGGDYYNAATYYHPTYLTATFNGSGYTGLIDTINNASAPIFAYSASHLLRAAYAGNAMLIQRASDSTTTAVGFNSNGTVNQTTISAFCASTTCNVKTWYDQSGNNLNANQATFANMPVIYTGGAVVTAGVNSEVAMKWDGTSRYMTASYSFSNTTNATNEALIVANFNSSVEQYAGVLSLTDGTHSGGGTAGLVCPLDYWTTSTVADVNTGAGDATQSITLGTQFLADSFFSLSNNLYVSINGGTFSGSPSALTSVANITTIDIGTDLPASTYYMYGTISDIVQYSNATSGALTTGQRAAAHTYESTFFGTP